jgi:hypothetical protein
LRAAASTAGDGTGNTSQPMNKVPSSVKTLTSNAINTIVRSRHNRNDQATPSGG